MNSDERVLLFSSIRHKHMPFHYQLNIFLVPTAKLAFLKTPSFGFIFYTFFNLSMKIHAVYIPFSTRCV
ncbi:hypothetical protein, partial [Enterobacter hormaechei]